MITARNGGGSEHGVGEEDREVDGPHRAGALEAHPADLEVVDEIRHQEDDRAAERREHGAAVGLDLPAPDQHPAEHEQHRRGGIECRVERRQIGERQFDRISSASPPRGFQGRRTARMRSSAYLFERLVGGAHAALAVDESEAVAVQDRRLVSSGVASTASRNPGAPAPRSPPARRWRRASAGRPASPRRSAPAPPADRAGVDGDDSSLAVELSGRRLSSSFIRAVSMGQEAGQRVKMKSTIAGRPARAALSSVAPLRSRSANSGSSESTGSGSRSPETRQAARASSTRPASPTSPPRRTPAQRFWRFIAGTDDPRRRHRRPPVDRKPR